jgi:hypothetical protein
MFVIIGSSGAVPDVQLILSIATLLSPPPLFPFILLSILIIKSPLIFIFGIVVVIPASLSSYGTVPTEEPLIETVTDPEPVPEKICFTVSVISPTPPEIVPDST